MASHDDSASSCDGVAVVDFAQPAAEREEPKGLASPPDERNVMRSPPQTVEDWDRFITSYTWGNFGNMSFVDDRPPSARSPPSSPSQHPPARPPLDPNLTSASSTVTGRSSVAPQSTVIDASRQRTLVAERSATPQSSGSTTSSDSSDMSRVQSVSASGPSNQDPAIPNIEMDELPNASTSTQRIMKVDDKLKEEKGKRFKEQGEMTRENMDQLGKEQSAERKVYERRHGKEEHDLDSRDSQREGEKGTGMERDAGKDTARPHVRQSTGGGKKVKRRGKGERGDDALAEMDDSSDDNAGPRPPLPRPRRPTTARRPRSRGSWASRHSVSPQGSRLNLGDTASLDGALFESGTNTSTSVSQVDLEFDQAAERARVSEFFEANGYLPAPRQTPDAMRRRLRVIRRLGLDTPEMFHRDTLDRLTRLSASFFKTRCALISVVGKNKTIFLSEVGFGQNWTELDYAFCSHTIMTPGSGETCMVVADAAKDWRFRNNPFVAEGAGPVQFYAGAPLRVGHGNKEAVIGSLCILDDKPREFGEEQRRLLKDLADCVVSELELIYTQQASVESAKLHQISVDFLRRSLKHRPSELAGRGFSGDGDTTGTGTGTTATGGSRSTGRSASSVASRKRIEGADNQQPERHIDIYDEACREIRVALEAYAVAVVDLSQFHLFYPGFQNSSTGGSSTRHASTSGGQSRGHSTGKSSTAPHSVGDGSSTGNVGDEGDAYGRSSNVKRARQTYAMTDPLAPSRTPQVLFIPQRAKQSQKQFHRGEAATEEQDNLAVLGYSCEYDGFAFNFTSTPAARRVIADFIASNVKTRRVWYTRDDSEGIAQSITHLMPPGTETSLAMPVFGFDGQVAFAVVACWKDPLYTYPSGALQFVETIAGSLLASVMKERLHQAERAQLNFAAAASHELRTPLHQINAAASLLRTFLSSILEQPVAEPSSLPPPLTAKDCSEIGSQLEIIEANGLSLGSILENIIDTLDIGKLASKLKTNVADQDPLVPTVPEIPRKSALDSAEVVDFSLMLEKVVDSAMELESKARRVASGKGLDSIEVIVEVLPRNRGGWKTTSECGPLLRALGKIIHNAVKFTDHGHIHITVQDVSRDVVMTAGYDNSIKISTVSIDIKDTGRGMSAEFLDQEVLRFFAKEDPFTTGSGLGLGLAQRMIELLGGKLAIASTPNKGTVVHIEVPMQLLNDDSDSDQDALGQRDEGPDGEGPGPVRQDGIYLVGWAESRQPAVRRVGKSLVRQLKLHFCRVVSEINYASLIVMPEGGVTDEKLAELCRGARPGVQVIVLDRDRSKYGQVSQPANAEHAHTNTPASPPSPNKHTTPDGSRTDGSLSISPLTDADVEYLTTVPITHLSRPLRPTVMARIMEPVKLPERKPETYVSDVVGGNEAREELALGLTNVHRSPEVRADSETPDDLALSPIVSRTPHLGTTEARPSLVTHVDGKPVQSARSVDTTSSTVVPSHRSAVRNPSAEGDQASVGSELSASASDSENSGLRPRLHTMPSDRMGQGHEPLEESALKVLVVEDNSVNRKILTTMLRRASCNFVEAVDGVEAVSQFTAFQPDLVLLDITMPRKDGFAAASEMRQLESKFRAVAAPEAHKAGPSTPNSVTGDLEDGIASLDLDPRSPASSTGRSSSSGWHVQKKRRARIIAVTAMSAEHQRRKGLYECGIDHWMTKPLSMSVLRTMVEKMKDELRDGATEVLAVEDDT
ncbi:hypothetical protein IAT38_006434 [Cryptococcus sp. DSM 104549]